MFPQTYDVYQILSGLQRALPQSTLSETSEKDYLSGEAKNAVLMEKNTNKPVVPPDNMFHKSNSSQPGGVITRCVQVARTPDVVALRDSKDIGKTTILFSHDEWTAFIEGVRKGEFDV